jgi:hypothetical protein
MTGNVQNAKKFRPGWNQILNYALSVQGTTGYAEPGCVVIGGVSVCLLRQK